MKRERGERIAFLDGLRAVAVLSVIVFHAGVHDAALRGGNPLTAALVRQGSHGVDLFFVLSGFCLSYPVLRRLRDAHLQPFDVAAFAARRIVRIVPPYYAALLLFAIAGTLLLAAHAGLPEGMDAAALSPGAVLRQMVFLDGDRRFADASFWTLAIEFRWYFAFPIVLWVWTRSPRAFAVIAFAALWAGATRAGNVDLIFLPTFMLGIVAADVYVREYRFAPRLLAVFPFAAAAAMLTTLHTGWTYVEAGPLWGVAMFCLVAGAGATPLLRRALSFRPIVGTGVASYGIYLVHEPVIGFIEQHAASLHAGMPVYAVACAGALAAGAIFSLLAERPFVSTPLRAALVAPIEGRFAQLFAACRIPRAIVLVRRPVQNERTAPLCAPAFANEPRETLAAAAQP